jgi:hypothetical protein
MDTFVRELGLESIRHGELVVGDFEHDALHRAPVVTRGRHVVVMRPAKATRNGRIGNLYQRGLVAKEQILLAGELAAECGDLDVLMLERPVRKQQWHTNILTPADPRQHNAEHQTAYDGHRKPADGFDLQQGKQAGDDEHRSHATGKCDLIDAEWVASRIEVGHA